MLLKKNALRWVMLSALFALSDQGAAQAAQQELVWSQSDGLRHEIYHSSGKDGTWEEPVKITDDNANNLHPAFAVAPDGARWVFWSAVNPDGISIGYAVGNDKKWSDPVKLETGGGSAITPSALIKDGVVWLVWAGNDGGPDEIYFSRHIASVWQEPKIINTANQVPDIKPEITLNEQGQIEVRWLGFRNGNYKKLVSNYGSGGWSPEQEFEEKKEEAEAVQIVLPEFLPKDSQYVVKEIPAEVTAK